MNNISNKIFGRIRLFNKSTLLKISFILTGISATIWFLLG